MNRGEVWWARLPPPAGRRPVVLVSRQSAYAVRERVTIAEVSTTVRAIPTEVHLGAKDGLPRKCVINTDNVVTLSKSYLEKKISLLRPEKIRELDAALAFSLGLDSV